MPIIAVASGGGDFELCPLGNTQAVCSFVEDVGVEHDEINDKWSHKVVVMWELAEKMKDGRPFMLSKSYTLSLHEKATLRKDLESWRGKAFTDAELTGFDLEKLLTVNCLLNVGTYKKKNGSEGRKIASISPMMKGMNPIIPINEKPPEWVQKRRDENEAAAASRQTAAPVAKAPSPSGHGVAGAPSGITDEMVPF